MITNSMTKEVFNLRTDPALKKAMMDRAKVERRTLTEVVERAFKNYLKTKPR